MKGALRLFVPSNDFAGIGLDKTFKRKEDYQHREMHNKKSFKNPMVSADRDRLRDELTRGFRSKSACDKDRLHEHLPQGAMSSTEQAIENSQSAGLTSILIEFAPAASSGTGDGREGNENSEKDSAEIAVESAAAEVAQRDVAAARNKAGAKALKDLNAWIGQFTQGVIDAHVTKESQQVEISPTHDQAFVNTLDERLAFSLAFLGVKIERLPACLADKAKKDLMSNDFHAAPTDFAAVAAQLKAQKVEESDKAFFTPPDVSALDGEGKNNEQTKLFTDKIHGFVFQAQTDMMKDPPCDDHQQLPCVPQLRAA